MCDDDEESNETEEDDAEELLMLDPNLLTRLKLEFGVEKTGGTDNGDVVE